MTDPFSLAKSDHLIAGEGLPQESLSQRLVVVPAPQREVRPLHHLAKVFGQFAELHQELSGHVAGLETSLHEQREDVATTVQQLPEMRERINWLISTLQDQGRKESALEARLAAQETSLAAINDTVRGLCDAHTHWNAALDEVIDILLRARALSVPAPPALDQ